MFPINPLTIIVVLDDENLPQNLTPVSLYRTKSPLATSENNEVDFHDLLKDSTRFCIYQFSKTSIKTNCNHYPIYKYA